jgi:shikimate dehydrogenase
LVIGSGGVGSAIAASFAKAGAADLGLRATSNAIMERLAERLTKFYPELSVLVGAPVDTGWNVIVNATPLGMNANDPLPMDVSRIAPSTFVGEVVMAREVTPFLAAARARGCQIQVGVDMLFEQIPAYLEFFGLRTTTPDELRSVAQIDYKF